MYLSSQSLSVNLHVSGKRPEVVLSELIFFKGRNRRWRRKPDFGSAAGEQERHEGLLLLYLILHVLSWGLKEQFEASWGGSDKGRWKHPHSKCSMQ